jgi:NAD(P)-dependent dehydrogenase (short-subunit alcohol dehydrogenase family)
MQGDVGKRDDVNKFVAAVVKEFGTVDILVNNAMAYNAKKIIDTTDEDVEKVMRSAVYGTLYCMQACFPYLKEHGGKVINFSSVAALYGAVDHGSYAIAKEGLSGFTKVAALEWAQYNIQVNAIAPLGESETSAAYAKLDPEEHVKHMKAIPMGRMGDPEKDIGRACVMLASSYADFITARTIFVDGGMGAIR